MGISISHVVIYFTEKGWSTDDAIAFYKHYLSCNCKSSYSWKAAAFHWMLKLIIEKTKIMKTANKANL